MCDTCGFIRCVPGCPEYDNGVKVSTCDRCREPIYEGDTVIISGDKTYCSCLLEEDRDVIIALLGGTMEKARA